MIKWMLVVVLLLLAGVGGYLYLERYEPMQEGMGDTSRVKGTISVESEVDVYQLKVPKKQAVSDWMTSPSGYNYTFVLTGDPVQADRLHYIDGDITLGSSAAKLADTELIITLYLTPEVLQDRQQSNYILSYLVLKTVSSMRGSLGTTEMKDTEIIDQLDVIRDQGGTYPVELIDVN